MTFLKPLAKPLLRLMIATAPAVAIADHPLPEGEQWNCQPGANSEWQCQSETAAGKYRRAKIPTKRQPQASTTAKKGPADNAWDWVAKAQLKDPSLCKTGCEGAYIEPERNWEDAAQKPDNAPLRADANATSSNNESVELTGDVHLTQGYRSIRAGEAVLDRRNSTLHVTDNVEVREPNLLIGADSASFNTETQLGSFQQARFLQHSSGYRGKAKSLERTSTTRLRLEQGMITQCTPEDEVWRFDASEIVLDTDEGWGQARHARLYVQDVPLFYIPYITFPIDDRRKTGFLWPTIASSNDNGAEVSVPYYLNLAPNYDVTITPRFVEKRGPMLELETRYLNRFGQWALAGADLQEDELYQETTQASDDPANDDEDDEIPPREHRWIGQLNHSGNILGISTFIDYNKASDVDFLDDFSTNSFEQKRRSNLNQEARLGFRSDDWQLELKAQQFQILDEFLSGQYKLMPQFTVEKNSTGKNFEPEYLFEAEYTDFQHDDSIDQGGRFVTGDRAFAEAGVSYPMRWAPGFIIPTAKVRSVSYDLEAFTPGSDDSPSATVPLATLDMGLIFERSMSFNAQSYTQTLEPRVYYFYSDYKDQSANPAFDTRELTFSFSQLYRDTRFSGHDRLDDANQVSVGVTSRFIDNEQGREQLTLSLGQIFYLEDRLVSLDSSTTLEDTRPDSNIAAEIQYQPTDNIWFTHSILWDPRNDKVAEGGFGFHYQGESKSLFNLGYRFRRDGDPLAGVGLRDLSQADASLALPLTDRWSAYARYRYDVEGNRSLDDLFGLQYEDCCWMVRLLYQQGLDDERYNALTDEVIVERDYAFILEFQLKGLGSLGTKAVSALKESILGYEDLE